MRVTAATSREPDTSQAAAEAAAEVEQALGGARVDLAFLFASAHHAEGLSGAVARVTERLRPGHLAGATGESIIGGGLEIESAPALALWAASAPGAQVYSAWVE